MLLIRAFETALLDLFSKGKLNGTTHTCLGQEYIPVALRVFLTDRDFVFSNHRGHGHYLARFEDPAGLLAEIMGREGAVCRGVGGSQHIYREGYLSTGVQGESLPVASGVALHLKRRGDGGLALAFIGDGTWGEGNAYESLNIARLWRLPLVVVTENNRIAQTTPVERQMAGTIEGRAHAFGVDHLKISTRDVREIRDILEPFIERVRSEHLPLVVEFDTDRLGPHSKGDDTRSAREMERARARDWYTLYAAAFPEQVAKLEEQARLDVAACVHDIEERTLSSWNPF